MEDRGRWYSGILPYNEGKVIAGEPLEIKGLILLLEMSPGPFLFELRRFGYVRVCLTYTVK